MVGDVRFFLGTKTGVASSSPNTNRVGLLRPTQQPPAEVGPGYTTTCLKVPGNCLFTGVRLTLSHFSQSLTQKTTIGSTLHVPTVLKIECFKMTHVVLVETGPGLLFFYHSPPPPHLFVYLFFFLFSSRIRLILFYMFVSFLFSFPFSFLGGSSFFFLLFVFYFFSFLSL